MDRIALARATDSTESPTPGYLYIDIAKMVASSPKACIETVQYLQKRLSGSKNANIKFKCLKVITKVSENPITRGQFKRQVCLTIDLVTAIKDSVQFRGVPDPVRGDAPYERVREAAKECLSAIYSDTTSTDSASSTMGMSHYSSSSSSTHTPNGGVGSTNSYPSSKMQGIGNPMFSDPRLQSPKPQLAEKIANMSLGEVVGTVGETVRNMIKDPLARGIPDARTGSMPIPGMPGFGSTGQHSYPPGRNELSDATRGQWTMASNRGPNAVGRYEPTTNNTSSYGANNASNNDSYYRPKDTAFSWAQPSTAPSTTTSSATTRSGGVGGSWGTVAGGVAAAAREPPVSNSNATRLAPYHNPTPTTNTPYGGTGGTALNDGTYERNLISELCPPSGMKAEPPVDKLEQFVRNLPSLNPDLICPALLDSLEDGSPWIARAKALCVIEKTIQATTVGDPNPYADFFHACASEIEPLTSHSRAAIRDPARRIWKELGFDLHYDNASESITSGTAAHVMTPTRTTTAPMSSPNAAVVPPEADLLDFGTNEPTTLPPPPAVPAPSISFTQSQEETLPQALPQQLSHTSLFGGLTVQQPPQESATPITDPHESLLIFGGNTTRNEDAVATVTVATMTTNDANKASLSKTPALFSNMSIKENINGISNTATAINEISDAATSSGSAFSFINNATTPEVSTVNSPVGTKNKESFDPLLSSDWSSKPQPSNVNAKMQALASYQANLMMMQNMQMQQLLMQQKAFQQQQQPLAINPQLNLQQHNPSVMQANSMRQIPILGQDSVQVTPNAFSFLRDDVSEKRKHEQQSFDFIKDAMKTAK